MTQEIEPKQIRAYVRQGITRLPVDVQTSAIQEIADNMGLRVEWYGVDPNEDTVKERELWAHQVRCTEIGMVHSLPVLRLTGKQLKGKDPKADFAGFMASLNAMYLMEANTGLTSKDRAKWRAQVSEVTTKPPPGTRSLSKKEASEMAKAGWKTRKKGVVTTWKSKARAKQRAHLVRHWKASDSARVAHETLPEFVHDMEYGVYSELIGISVASLGRICKPTSE